MPPFLDSNVILYSAARDSRKAHIADQLIADGAVISTQVLNEIANVARRKMGYEWSTVRDFLLVIQATVDVISISLDVHEAGLAIAERYQLSVYDGMIVGAAMTAGCDLLYSEDMHHGLVIDSRLQILNPFRT